MILVPQQLKHFLNFVVTREDKRVNNSGYIVYYDVIVVKYYKYELLWGFISRTDTWSEKHSFKRTERPSTEEGADKNLVTYSATSEFLELEAQLKDIINNKWLSISQQDYDYFSKKYPERFV